VTEPNQDQSAQNPTAPAVAPHSPVDKPRVQTDQLPPEALTQRLERERETAQKTLLTALGVTNIEEAKAAVDAAKKASESAKSDAEKLASLNLKMTDTEAALDIAIQQASSRLTPEQKAAVDSIAGNHKPNWLRTLAALEPVWKSSAPAAPTQPAAPVPPPPANTAPAVPPPPPAGPMSPVDHAATYAALQKTSPWDAAQYLVRNGEICLKKA
jgi:hypothetical protein